jgi:hypothetical protein
MKSNINSHYQSSVRNSKSLSVPDGSMKKDSSANSIHLSDNDS